MPHRALDRAEMNERYALSITRMVLVDLRAKRTMLTTAHTAAVAACETLHAENIRHALDKVTDAIKHLERSITN